ncbi:MAG: hypothetical protein EOP05_13575, partial [Proteobacteria bacterium]
MSSSNPRNPKDSVSHSRRYVDFEAGFRPFLICLLIAAVLGLGFRLALSPKRLKTWVTQAVNEQRSRTGSHFAYSFDSAEIRLSDGWVPQFAVVLKGVKVAPAPECQPEPSLQIAELSLPLRVSRLVFQRKFAVGVVSAADLVVDLDGLKKRCVAGETLTSQTQPPPSGTSPQVALTETSSEEVRPWWNEKQLTDLESVIEGVDFRQV